MMVADVVVSVGCGCSPNSSDNIEMETRRGLTVAMSGALHGKARGRPNKAALAACLMVQVRTAVKSANHRRTARFKQNSGYAKIVVPT